MLLHRKKGAVELDLLLLLLTISLILITVILILYPVSSNMIEIDEKKLKTQMVVKKLFQSENLMNKKCFFDKFATIKKEDFTQENLDKCFENQDEKVLFKVKIVGETKYIYGGDKDALEDKISIGACSYESNVLCSWVMYPVTFVEEDEYKIRKLNLVIVASS